MKELLKYFGVPVSDNVQVSEINLAFHGISTGMAAFLALIVIGITAWAYLRNAPTLTVTQKTILTVLRSLLLGMILFMLMRPVLLLTVEGTIRRSLLLLVDSSQSMQIKDLRQDPDDLRRAGIAKGVLDPKGGLTQGVPSDSSLTQMSRSDVLKAMLTNDRLQLLSKLGDDYDVVPYAFGQTLQALSGSSTPGTPEAPSTAPAPIVPGAAVPASKSTSFLDTLAFDKPYTAIGDAVRSLLDLKRGQPLAGILLVTDGNNNYGSQPMDAAALAQQDKVPLYIYGVGIAAPHDIIVAQVYAPEVEFAKEDATAQVTVRSQAMKGRSAKLVLKLGDEEVASQDISFGDDGEQVVPMKFQPKVKGEYDLEASIEPLPDEAVKDNNKATQRIRVIDGKVNVLYVETKPRWEFRYLQAMMLRDRRLDAKFYLVESPNLSEEENSPYLAALPPTKEDWMKYDVVIIGDVDSSKFKQEQMQSISDLVSTFGGGMVFLAGKSFMPDSYIHTPLEALFPVEFAGQGSTISGGPSTRLVSLELTPAGQSSPTMRLAGDENENTDIWKNLPGIYWDARVAKAKPAAEVLLDDASPEKGSRAGLMPVIALQGYGAGQTVFVGTDETWRWRKNVGEKYYTRFWGQVLLRLGLPRLLGASRLTQLVTEKKSYVSGERVTISGRLYHSGFESLLEPTVNGTVVIKPDDAAAPVADLRKAITLQAAPGRPGYYEGELVVTTPGIYSFTTENDPDSSLDFRVSEPKFEFTETALNLALLKKMAETSGGAFFREEDMYRLLEPGAEPVTGVDATGKNKLPSGLGGGSVKVPSPQEVEMAFSPLYYSIMVLVAALEWILRKRWRLK